MKLAPFPKSRPIARWENEGGAVRPSAGALPDGITSDLAREYRVGSYRFTDLAHAIYDLNRRKASENK